jgi:hypothetical protein
VDVVVSNSPVPVFECGNNTEGTGLTAGVEEDFYLQGKTLGDTMADILNGRTRIEDIDLLDPVAPIEWFDYGAFRRYGLDISYIPDDAYVYNEPVSLLEIYRPVLEPLTIIIAGLISLLIGMYWNYRTLEKTNLMLEKAEEQLRHDAYFDQLLEIYNTHVAEELIENNISDGKEQCILRIDIDNFNEINENYGYFNGDRFLVFIASHLKKYAQENSAVFARYNGDEILHDLFRQTSGNG